MSMWRVPGVICCFRSGYDDLDDGLLSRSICPPPGVYLYRPENDVTEDEKREFDLLQKYVKVLDGHKKEYKNARAYIDHRNEYFGSEAEYKTFAQESDQELEDTEWKGKKRTIKLRQLLEINQHPDAQNIFYRWVRKAYFKKLGSETNVPELIRAGMTPKLIEAIGKVRTSYKKNFTAGGFNPRPVKLNGKYVLGTLSEHGLGLAADINDATNKQFKKSEWDFIVEFTGKKVDRSLSRWNKDPKGLWTDIKAVNDAWVKKIADEIKRIETERAAAEKTPGAKPDKRVPIDVVLAGHLGLKDCQSGFFTLDWDLVDDLHDQDFTWGATFSDNVDLHHFELSA